MVEKTTEQQTRVAFLGPEGTFSQSAVVKHFGASITGISLATIEEVFSEIEIKAADFGVVPVENSTEGLVSNTLDMFLMSSLCICGEVEVPIRQYLMSQMDTLEEINKVYSHPQSLAQCRAWLAASLPMAEIVPVSSNAAGASQASVEKGAAAIAGDAAANVYGLNILGSDIQDQANNATRFLVIGSDPCEVSGNDKTTILLSASGTKGPGALLNLLKPLAKHNINMTRIQSRPSRKRNWDYVFFVDIDGHRTEKNIMSALKEVEGYSSLFRVLGSYPKANY
ncbi:MAG: prephenate dehydratase [Rhodospirillaceae bacterium]|nr:prephenate dehydratase [Rhodospirillaceae bacterium]|tara:strand:- start:11137 stop:11982 length:846 start_codon:yes stop_codon:yes gene_type:complete